MLHALQFMDGAGAYLSIQASSASADRLFGDAGIQEATRRQHTDVFISNITCLFVAM